MTKYQCKQSKRSAEKSQFFFFCFLLFFAHKMKSFSYNILLIAKKEWVYIWCDVIRTRVLDDYEEKRNNEMVQKINCYDFNELMSLLSSIMHSCNEAKNYVADFLYIEFRCFFFFFREITNIVPFKLSHLKAFRKESLNRKYDEDCHDNMALHLIRIKLTRSKYVTRWCDWKFRKTMCTCHVIELVVFSVL